ncbi:MAG: glutamate-5-semialdehyde dehydrogenase [Verrucomicrobia bacterium]|nr:glutamate-5-semialdehyde dehydrogenase [Verrucomicrobiota bacterium]MBV9673016.1 glutamate-5-semialdehyde dehydrogenase [Verrucomicrobiota bacterium]
MNVELAQTIERLGQNARRASRALSLATTDQKNAALLAIGRSIEQSAPEILAANAADLKAGQDLSSAMLDRLRVDPKRLQAIADSVRNVVLLADPVGETIKGWSRPNGLQISKQRIPIGVIGIIYESRPNVTCDAASLCIKTGNAVILRGGSESIRTNLALVEVLRSGCHQAGCPEDSVQLVSSTDRTGVKLLAQLDRYIDLIIPRGGRALIEAVVSSARMPVIKHFDGICHVFVDAEAQIGMATEIVINAKCQRPGVCNALETLLVHEKIAPKFLPACAEALWQQGVEIRGDQRTLSLLGEKVLPASEEDWRTEYLALILSVRIVRSLDEAIDHIEEFGSHHSDAIVTEDEFAAEKFLRSVDSAAVFWNASTRFNDGGEFGFGAEIGISTDRLHARGPMGLEELTSYKYTVRGNGHVR